MEKTPLIKEKITEYLRCQICKIRTDALIRIDSERVLSENLGVSRISIRSAIKNLVNEGLLVQIQGKGTYITPAFKNKTLHIICSPDIKSNDPFYNKFLVEITNIAAKESINIFMINPNQIKDCAETSPIIIVGLLGDNILHKLTAVYKKIIAIQEYPDSENIVQIYYDDYKIGCQAAKTFIQFGHKRLFHLAGPDKYPSAFYRKKGFLDTAKDLGLSVCVLTEKMNWSGGYKTGDLFINSFSPDNINSTGIFAANDWMAVGFIQKLRENGFSVPDDLSVIGCDDIALSSEFSPTITTFNLDMKYLVTEVFSIFNEMNYSKENYNKKILLPATLIHRKSLLNRNISSMKTAQNNK